MLSAATVLGYLPVGIPSAEQMAGGPACYPLFLSLQDSAGCPILWD